MISVANYTVESLIHEGPLSAVYRGYRNADNVPVVFKLPRSLPADATEVPRIKHEAKVLSLLQDVPGVAHALNMDTTSDGVPVLIIEYVAGRQLDDLIARVKTETGSAFGLPVVDVLHIGLALVDILSQVHERLIVHKDIKPHKITPVEKWLSDFLIPSEKCGEISTLHTCCFKSSARISKQAHSART